MELKRLIVTMFALICCVVMFPQKMSVEKMEVLGMDTYASVHKRLDNNGTACAAVKVSLPLAGATFSGTNHMGTIDRIGADYIIFMPAGSKKMYIQHPNFHELEVVFGDYGIERLQSVVTYRVTVNLPQTVGANQQKMQTLNIKVTPSNAIVRVDGDILEELTTKLAVGVHKYNVTARGYIAQEGAIELGENVPETLIVKLAPKRECEACGKMIPDCEYKGKHGFSNEHEWIDLGLSSGTCWATYNINAKEDYVRGDFYQWGATNHDKLGVKSDAHERFAAYRGRDVAIYDAKYDVPVYLDSIHDAATVIWGTDWRTPTCAEYQELLDECQWEWTRSNGSEGFTITGPNGHSIFLPAGGISGSGYTINQNECNYHTSQSGDLGGDKGKRAFGVMFSEKKKIFKAFGFVAGCLVRPVTNLRPISMQMKDDVTFRELGKHDVTLYELFKYPFGDNNSEVLLESASLSKVQKYVSEKNIRQVQNIWTWYGCDYVEKPICCDLRNQVLEDSVTYRGFLVYEFDFSCNPKKKQGPPRRHIIYRIDLNSQAEKITENESVRMFKSIIQEANMLWSSNSLDVSREELSKGKNKVLLSYEIKRNDMWVIIDLNNDRTVMIEFGLDKK